jgi:autotransporter-associated beta strand protein
LVTWTGSGPANTNAFATLDLPAAPAVTGYLSVSGNTLYLNVVTVSALSWNTGNGDWDTITQNWTNIALNVAAAYTDLTNAVLFNDAAGATGNPSVNLTGAFSPLSVQMNSSSHDYTITNTLSGTGNIGGSGPLILDVANTRTLTLATSNSYTGGTFINGGTLALSGAGTLGATNGSVTLSGGRLDLGGLTATNGAVLISAAAARHDHEWHPDRHFLCRQQPQRQRHCFRHLGGFGHVHQVGRGHGDAYGRRYLQRKPGHP